MRSEWFFDASGRPVGVTVMGGESIVSAVIVYEEAEDENGKRVCTGMLPIIGFFAPWALKNVDPATTIVRCVMNDSGSAAETDVWSVYTLYTENEAWGAITRYTERFDDFGNRTGFKMYQGGDDAQEAFMTVCETVTYEYR